MTKVEKKIFFLRKKNVYQGCRQLCCHTVIVSRYPSRNGYDDGKMMNRDGEINELRVRHCLKIYIVFFLMLSSGLRPASMKQDIRKADSKQALLVK
jgi:hypothetical protein